MNPNQKSFIRRRNACAIPGFPAARFTPQSTPHPQNIPTGWLTSNQLGATCDYETRFLTEALLHGVIEGIKFCQSTNPKGGGRCFYEPVGGLKYLEALRKVKDAERAEREQRNHGPKPQAPGDFEALLREVVEIKNLMTALLACWDRRQS